MEKASLTVGVSRLEALLPMMEVAGMLCLAIRLVFCYDTNRSGADAGRMDMRRHI